MGVVTCALTLAAGCGGIVVDQSTRLTIGDMRTIVAQTVEAFAASPWVAARAPDSPEAVITFTEMVNASDDVITRSELWYLAQSVATTTFGDRDLREGKNVTLVVPADKLDAARRRGTITARAAPDRDVTHTMTGRIDNVPRSDADGRTDLYVASYQLVDLETGAIEWTGSVEFERAAFGRSFN